MGHGASTAIDTSIKVEAECANAAKEAFDEVKADTKAAVREVSKEVVEMKAQMVAIFSKHIKRFFDDCEKGLAPLGLGDGVTASFSLTGFGQTFKYEKDPLSFPFRPKNWNSVLDHEFAPKAETPKASGLEKFEIDIGASIDRMVQDAVRMVVQLLAFVEKEGAAFGTKVKFNIDLCPVQIFNQVFDANSEWELNFKKMGEAKAAKPKAAKPKGGANGKGASKEKASASLDLDLTPDADDSC